MLTHQEAMVSFCKILGEVLRTRQPFSRPLSGKIEHMKFLSMSRLMIPLQPLKSPKLMVFFQGGSWKVWEVQGFLCERISEPGLSLEEGGSGSTFSSKPKQKPKASQTVQARAAKAHRAAVKVWGLLPKASSVPVSPQASPSRTLPAKIRPGPAMLELPQGLSESLPQSENL